MTESNLNERVERLVNLFSASIMAHSKWLSSYSVDEAGLFGYLIEHPKLVEKIELSLEFYRVRDGDEFFVINAFSGAGNGCEVSL